VIDFKKMHSENMKLIGVNVVESLCNSPLYPVFRIMQFLSNIKLCSIRNALHLRPFAVLNSGTSFGTPYMDTFLS